MPEGTVGRILVAILILLIGYLAIGNLLHRAVFPQTDPDPASYPRVGDVLVSRVEGFTQTVTGVEGEWLISELIIEPNALGPPLHYHDSFKEQFSVVEGTLHVRVDAEVKKVGPGESILIPAGVPHQPFNPTTDRVVVSSQDPSIPITFAACLVQLYAKTDAEEPISGLGMALQMSVIDPICDTHLVAIPSPVEGLLKVALAPAARLLGYRNYYPENALH
jgi:mannose-6-phosphate isomerase-like protein (cupin superfamily)